VIDLGSGAVMPEARLLRYFLTLAEELNFTRAAERLQIAQPALSSQIRRLEAQLGTQLLERTTRAVTLTDAGHELVARGPAALAALEQAWDSARRAGRGESGRLVVAYSPSAGYETAPGLLAVMRERHPAVVVRTQMMPTPEINDAVRDGHAHVGIARMPRLAAGLRAREIRTQRLGALVAPDHPLAALAEVRIDVLVEHPIALHPRAANPGYYDFIVGLLRAAGREPRLVEPPVAFDPGRGAIRSGHALALLGEPDEPPADGLRWVPLADGAPELVSALVLRDGELPAVVDRFERVAAATAASRGWLTPRRIPTPVVVT
jgi:LysR family transcriptional regulator, benzoate and cis,cis-muconate-responsive activator of ben and cat genes